MQQKTKKTEDVTLIKRRELLKILAATSGAVITVGSLPGEWSKPVIQAGVLPAHAQITPCQISSLQITMNWTAGATNLNLVVREPDGTEVSPTYTSGPTLSHSGDDAPSTGSSGQEVANASVNNLTGTYTIIVDSVPITTSEDVSGQVTNDVSITIITNCNTETLSGFSIADGDRIEVATASFPSGNINRLI